MKDGEQFHDVKHRVTRKYGFYGGIIGALLGVLLGFYFGGYPGFLFFKQFRWFFLPLTLRTYLGLMLGVILGIFIFWAFGTILGGLYGWLIARWLRGKSNQ